MPRKRKVGPEPLPSREKYFTEAQLRRETLKHCRAWHRWCWGDDDFSFLDYRGEIAQWPKTRDIEAKARPIWNELRPKIESALEFAEAYDDDSGSFWAQGLSDIAPQLREVLKTFAGASTSKLPVEPSRRTWLLERIRPYADGRHLEAMPRSELARYSLLGGFWPTNVVSGARRRAVDVLHGVSALGVLSEEQKYIAKALKERPWEAELARKLRGHT